MRTLQNSEIKSVSGAGLLISAVKVGAVAGKAVVGGVIDLGKATVRVGGKVLSILI
jgi:hypothetical protein